MSRFAQAVTRILPIVVVMGGIFFLSSIPGDRLALPRIPHIDKVAHMAAYGLLAVTVFYAFGSRARRLYPCLLPLLVLLICTLYGITDEYHQSFVPNRSPDPLDVVADSLGAVVVCLLHSLRTRPQKEKRHS